MTTNHEQQLEAIKPLLDQIQSLLAQGQHPDASVRFKPAPKPSGIEGGAVKGKTALGELSDYHHGCAERLKSEIQWGCTPDMIKTMLQAKIAWHQRMSAACAEADNN